MLRLHYNLFNGGSDIARVRETGFQTEEAMQVHRNTYRQVDESATSLPSVGHGTPALPGDWESEQIGVSALRWGL